MENSKSLVPLFCHSFLDSITTSGETTSKYLFQCSKVWINDLQYIQMYSPVIIYWAHYRPYQGSKKGKQVPSSATQGLGHNIVLGLMKCLTPTLSFYLFMDNYFTSFCLFVCLPITHLNNIQAKGTFNKNRLCKYTIIGDRQQQKKEQGHFEQCNTYQGKTLFKWCYSIFKHLLWWYKALLDEISTQAY